MFMKYQFRDLVLCTYAVADRQVQFQQVVECALLQVGSYVLAVPVMTSA